MSNSTHTSWIIPCPVPPENYMLSPSALPVPQPQLAIVVATKRQHLPRSREGYRVVVAASQLLDHCCARLMPRLRACMRRKGACIDQRSGLRRSVWS